MKRILVTLSFDGFEHAKKLVDQWDDLVRKAGLEPVFFVRDVEHYQETFTNSHKLMQQAKELITTVDYLLIDVTDKPTGRAIEAGIAYALGVRVIITAKQGTTIKATMHGIAHKVIVYDHLEQLSGAMRGAQL